MVQSEFKPVLRTRNPKDFDYNINLPYTSSFDFISSDQGPYTSSSASSSNGTPRWPTDEFFPLPAELSTWKPPPVTDFTSDSSTPGEEESDESRWLEVIPSISRTKRKLSLGDKRQRPNFTSAVGKHGDAGLHAFMGPKGIQAVNINEFSLYDETSKSFIISGLRQIYDNSLENGMSLWGMEDNCPYEKNSLWYKRGAVREDSSSLAPMSLSQRAGQLDKVFAPLRDRPLTAAEEAGSQRTLKLAMMAFASRWSNTPTEEPKAEDGKPSADKPTDQHATSRERKDSKDFEVLLQQSMYAAAMASLERWSQCDSFRVILAKLLVFFIKRPPDEDEVAEVQGLWQSAKAKSRSGSPDVKQTTPPYDHTGAKSKSPSPPQDEKSNDRFSASESFRKLMKSDTRKNFLGSALRHLLAWSPKVRGYVKDTFLQYGYAAPDSPQQRQAMQVESSFNILFWLGVMCDTASSALDRRDLTISDEDAELQLQNPEMLDKMEGKNGVPDPTKFFGSYDSADADDAAFPKLWGSFLMQTYKACEDPFVYESTERIERCERNLREASPLKILLLRKICNLQKLMQDHADALTIESCISDTLQVCTYWTIRFGAFFKNCLKYHEQLPWKVRTWYVMLVGHWNLGYLHVANCVEKSDQDLTSTTIQAQIRKSSCLVQQLQKEGSYWIADIARAASKDVTTNGYDKTNINVHSTCRDSSMLTDPCGDLMFLALSSACDTFLGWSQALQLPPVADDSQSIWLHANVDSRDLHDHYSACTEALKIFGRQYDVATLTVKFYEEQIKNVGVKNLLQHRSYIRQQVV